MQFLPHRKHCIYITKTSQLMLVREVIAVYCETVIRYVGKCRFSFFNIEARSAFSALWVNKMFLPLIPGVLRRRTWCAFGAVWWSSGPRAENWPNLPPATRTSAADRRIGCWQDHSIPLCCLDERAVHFPDQGLHVMSTSCLCLRSFSWDCESKEMSDSLY